MKPKQLQLTMKLQTKHSPMSEETKDRKEDRQTIKVKKSEKKTWKKANILPMFRSTFTGKKSIPAYSFSFKRWNKKIPSIADNKDNVIARRTVLGYTVFVSLETSPLERLQG